MRLIGLITLMIITMGGACVAQVEPQPASRVTEIHQDILTLDTHVDIPLNFATPDVDPGRMTDEQLDLPKMRAGYLDAAVFVVYTPSGPLTEGGYANAADIADTRWRAIHRMVLSYPDQIGLAASPSEVERIDRSGRQVAIVGMENAYPLAESPEHLAEWAERGLAYVGLVHNGTNQFADSALPDLRDSDAPVHGGLSELGRTLISVANDVGVLVDVSHANHAATMQAAKLSRAPIIASHSAATAVEDHPRNLNDEAIRAIANTGGVIHVVALGSYLRAPTPEMVAGRLDVRRRFGINSDAERRALDDETNKRYVAAIEESDARFPPVTVSHLVDHIDHIVSVVGVDHVGVASDFGGGGGIGQWRDASQAAAVTRELLRRGYSVRDIRKIWGGNFLRAWRDAQRAAK